LILYLHLHVLPIRHHFHCNANDRRSTLLSATPAGRKLLMDGRARRVRALAKQIAALSREQRAALHKTAEILKEVIRAI